jgi:hypothetical protein
MLCTTSRKLAKVVMGVVALAPALLGSGCATEPNGESSHAVESEAFEAAYRPTPRLDAGTDNPGWLRVHEHP